MNINKTQEQSAQCCVDYCSARFSDGEQTIVNSYKCDGKRLSPADVWYIQRQRKEVSLKNNSL
jgi:hypothetical protein